MSVNPAGLNPGTYNGAITIAAPGASNSPATVAVTLVVGAVAPTINGVLNAASFAESAFAPGSIVSLFGSSLGPEKPVSMDIKSDNSVNTVLAGIRVLFNGHPGPLLFVQAGQINAIVPFQVAGQSKAHLQIECDGKQYDSFDIPLTDTSPALFTSDASGRGQGAILNEDYSLNSGEKPASRGSVIMLYATGGGMFDRAVPDGAVTGADLARLALPASVQIDGVESDVLYAGSAPGLVASVIQVNVKVPETVHSGSVSVVLKVGNLSSQADVTLAVR